jgi:malate dehydrogenase (oxaloacetate-decarboxylating)
MEYRRDRAEIPIWHDDQQGTATAVLAGLLNAIDLVGKKLSKVRIAFILGTLPIEQMCDAR